MSAIDRPGDWHASASPVQSAARSHVGRVRSINEDRVFDWPNGGVWAVVDGMGGHRGGDLAAQTVIDALRGLDRSDACGSPASILAALGEANDQIFARNTATGEQAGATVVTLCVQGATVHIAWAGDSRCYRVRGHDVEQLTRDHSLVQELVDAGLLTDEAAAHHPQANVITRAIGVGETCDFSSCLADFVDGDRFLLCSDGLSRSLQGSDLIDIGLDALADDLLAKALERDGADNISLILVEPHPQH